MLALFLLILFRLGPPAVFLLALSLFPWRTLSFHLALLFSLFGIQGALGPPSAFLSSLDNHIKCLLGVLTAAQILIPKPTESEWVSPFVSEAPELQPGEGPPGTKEKKYPEKAHRSLPSDGIAPSRVFINRCVLKIICDHSLLWEAVLIINSFLDYFLPFPSLLSP